MRTVLRRARQLRDLSPLTGLPGNAGITRELAARIAARRPLAVIHVDIDNFKSYNDTYGFLRGDGVITLCALCLQRAAAVTAGPAFIGHIGGDDFVVLLDPDDVARFCEHAIAEWDETIPDHYDTTDADRGFVVVADRQGATREAPLATLSMGVATNAVRRFSSEWEASAIAAEMKEFAKRQLGSNYQIDRRRG